jgi:hypothetical protein
MTSTEAQQVEGGEPGYPYSALDRDFEPLLGYFHGFRNVVLQKAGIHQRGPIGALCCGSIKAQFYWPDKPSRHARVI